MHRSLVLNGNVLVCVCVRGTWVQETVLPFSSLDVGKPTRGRAARVEAKQTSLLPPPESLSSAFPLAMRRGGAGREGRGLALNRPVQALYFFLWASDRQREED